MYSVYLKKTEQSETILRNSLFDILRFCGSLFNVPKFHISTAAGLKSGQFNHQETVPFWCSFTRGVRAQRGVDGKLSALKENNFTAVHRKHPG
jgi:hypothetical protein